MIKEEATLKGKDIVMLSLQPWYFKIGNNAKNMAALLSLNNRVIYVNHPIKRKAYRAGKTDPNLEKHIHILRNNEDRLIQHGPQLWEFYPGRLIESINGLPSTTLFRCFNYINNLRLAKDIKEAMAKLGFHDIILFNDNDIYNGYFMKKLLSPTLSIYYFRDFLQAYPYWKRHTTILEPELIRNSDLVVANSLYFTEYSKKFNANAYYIGQGCDLSNFDSTRTFPVPADIQHLPRPLIGYVGALHSARLDISLIASIASQRPDWTVVLVGPEDEAFQESHLHQIPNIHFTGRKPMDQLPAYVQAFDACINPQLQNEITRGNYPLKIDEYLAMGRPVIATRTTTMSIFEEHTYLADRPSDYPLLIQKALEEDSSEKKTARISFAHTHTWENCMIALYDAIQHTKTPL